MKESQNVIRVAHIIGKWVGGGVESVVMNYYNYIDREKIQFDFICDEDSTNIPYDEIEKLGGKVILIPPYQRIVKYHKTLKNVLKDGNYKIVHSHINTLSVFSLFAAKCAGVPVRIAHSHSTTNKKEKKKNILKQILRPFSKLFATDYMCCSEYAGRWLFGNKEYNKGNVYLLNNAIDLDKFKYDEKVRIKKRKELNIEDDTLVIGHVGRFVEQKNHRFLIDIFNEVHKQNDNSILILVGQGPLIEEMKNKIKSLDLENCVKFLGQRKDINELYQTMDLFLFPSLYEGLGMALVEAQMSGLYCLTSDVVPTKAKVSNNIEFISLRINERKWADHIRNIDNSLNRKMDKKKISCMGFDIKNEALKLENKYLDLNKNEHVELFGVPGSGKSTYVKENNLKKYDLNNKINGSCRLKRNIKKCTYMISILVFKRNINKNIKSVIEEFEFPSFKVKLKMLLYMYSIIYLILRNKNKNYVMDEGILQVIWAFGYNSENENYDIEYCLKKLKNYLPDKVIYLNVEEEIIYERLSKRNNKGGSELEHDITMNKNYLTKAKQIENRIIDCLNKEFEIKVVK